MGNKATANVIAALASFFVPGLGQAVQGKIALGLFFFLVCGACYFLSALILPLLVAVPLHIWSIYNAATDR